ncbi:MAG: leucine-rich repeat domain-containing protein, partial [Bacteroidaceae bacterium]|nr:leucine-rich repeat domain-containing protein [Bacteroidaceae bacterium]
IPDTVETIGKSAFDQCISLVHVVIPDKVTTIGPKAFQRCNALKSVTIGKGVTQIGDNAFKNCETLKTLTWLAEGDVALGVDVFSGTTNTANVDLLMTYHHADEITDLVNWNGYTFKTIRVLCADGTLNHTTDYTGNNDLSHHIACSTCGYVGDEVHAYGENGTCGICSYTCTHTTFAGGTCICGKITGGYCGAEGDGKNLTWTLVDGVLTISGEGAMKECSKSAELPWAADRAEIHSVEIGNGVTTIAKYAFAYFALLTEVQIPDSVVSISTGAFGECRKLEKINIPAKVTVIPEKAFFNCESLKSITLEGNITTIETKAFQYCDKLTEILLPSSVETIGEYVFFHCWRLSEIVIPDSVTSIGVGAFMECGTLKNVTIGKGVTQIGDGAFGYCTALETLTWLAEGDVSLGENVFEETNTANIDLLLTYHHADEITDLVNWNGYTFKSIRVLCADGTLNHTADYTANTDGTHGINCSTCGYVVNEVHAPQYAPKDNATHEMTCTLCGYAATEACSGGEGTATCINRKVCDLCQAPYGELNP